LQAGVRTFKHHATRLAAPFFHPLLGAPVTSADRKKQSKWNGEMATLEWHFGCVLNDQL
jgi:hypothetical protein